MITFSDYIYDIFESTEFFSDNITGRYVEMKLINKDNIKELKVYGSTKYYRDGEKLEEIIEELIKLILRLSKPDRSYEKIEINGSVTTIKLELYKSKIKS